MATRLPDYVPCKDCNEECHYGSDERPCWGRVEVVAEACVNNCEDHYWIHACQGHVDLHDGGPYRERDQPAQS